MKLRQDTLVSWPERFVDAAPAVAEWDVLGAAASAEHGARVSDLTGLRPDAKISADQQRACTEAVDFGGDRRRFFGAAFEPVVKGAGRTTPHHAGDLGGVPEIGTDPRTSSGLEDVGKPADAFSEVLATGGVEPNGDACDRVRLTFRFGWVAALLRNHAGLSVEG